MGNFLVSNKVSTHSPSYDLAIWPFHARESISGYIDYIDTLHSYVSKRKKLICQSKDLYKMFIVALVVITIKWKQPKFNSKRTNNDNGILHSKKKKKKKVTTHGCISKILFWTKRSDTKRVDTVWLCLLAFQGQRQKLIYGGRNKTSDFSGWFGSSHVDWDGQEGDFWEMDRV